MGSGIIPVVVAVGKDTAAAGRKVAAGAAVAYSSVAAGHKFAVAGSGNSSAASELILQTG